MSKSMVYEVEACPSSVDVSPWWRLPPSGVEHTVDQEGLIAVYPSDMYKGAKRGAKTND